MSRATLIRVKKMPCLSVPRAVGGERFGKTSFVSVGRLDELATLVTGRDPGDDWRDRLNEAGVRLVIAG